ncbi:unnamed protein product [Strongylus vulgaris]|uniref:Protein-tyrosine sulfotransferase n=1 Tax=Strongylus vulgaris TaxID=40348 RepID=A0A3P7ILH4_STRVU|nr:unnamed protein product [Strongylus vulgaris]
MCPNVQKMECPTVENVKLLLECQRIVSQSKVVPHILLINTIFIAVKVYYERLVQRTEDEARRILNFLDVPWTDDVLRHEEKIGSEVKLNPEEFSTSQVKEKVNKKALTSWFGCYSDDVLKDIDKLAPLLRQLGKEKEHRKRYMWQSTVPFTLGYNTSAREPDYEEFAGKAADFYSNVYKL